MSIHIFTLAEPVYAAATVTNTIAHGPMRLTGPLAMAVVTAAGALTDSAQVKICIKI